jgi:hypothetical protein
VTNVLLLAVFSPVLYVLDQVMNITKVKPETPHEEAFQR